MYAIPCTAYTQIWILKSSRLLLDLLCLVQYKYNNRRNFSTLVLRLPFGIAFNLILASKVIENLCDHFFSFAFSFGVKDEGVFCQWVCLALTRISFVCALLQTWCACIEVFVVYKPLKSWFNVVPFRCKKEKTQFFFSAWTVTAIQKSNFEIWILAFRFEVQCVSSSVMAILLFVICITSLPEEIHMHASLIPIVIETHQSCWLELIFSKPFAFYKLKDFFRHTFNANHKYMNSSIIPRLNGSNLWIKKRDRHQRRLFICTHKKIIKACFCWKSICKH